MDIVLVFFVILIAFLIAVGIFFTFLARRLAPTKYEWLLVMSHHKYKRAPALIRELLELKQAKYPTGLRGIIYTDLGQLEDEELIEVRQTLLPNSELLVSEYKLTAAGTRKKNEKLNTETSELPKHLKTQ